MADRTISTPIENANAHSKIRLDQLETNRFPTSFERANGVGTRAYGGLNALGTENSLVETGDKWYKAYANGRSMYGLGQISKRLFNQLTILDRETLAQINPHITGRGIFFIGEMPRFMEILYPEETEYVRTMMTSTIVGISGFNDARLDVSEIKGPTDQNSIAVVTGRSGATRSITITYMMLLRGLPMYKYDNTWMQFVYNPGSSAATYPYFTELDYNEGNHTMNAIYAVVDPSYQVVEEAVLIYKMIPTENGAANILNQTWGEHSVQQRTVTYACHTLPTGMPQVLKIASALLADYVSEVELHDYRVVPASDINDPDNSTMGLGSDIMFDPARAELARLNTIEKGQ